MGLQTTLPHKSQHETGAPDALTPTDIGAVASVPADTLPITTIRALAAMPDPPDPNTLYIITP